MQANFLRRARLCAGASALTALLAACGGGGGNAALPQLSAAAPQKLTGSCADLSTRLGTLANTSITAVVTVPSGSLTVAGQPIAEHCMVNGQMFKRVSPVDGN
ncbi:MAG: tannase/feruloyl esterase family alpha/beta hydrolase, partial [Comamonadaceae bacterium]